jgi:hypothetical protein
MFEECKYYIDRLTLPQGFGKDIIGIFSAESMCAGYNAGMNSTDAKYKVYLHQDVLIKNQNFISDIVEIFNANEKIGMIGMIGGTHMPNTGTTYKAWDVGIVDCREVDMAYYFKAKESTARDLTIVEAVDGLLIATQYDIPWREDIFKHFHFYDVSQAFEMRKAGYDIVVPTQGEPWAVHACNFASMKYYDDGRQILLREYPEFLYADGYEFEYNSYNAEWDAMAAALAVEIKAMMAQGKWDDAERTLEEYHKGNIKSSELEMLCIMSEITRTECEEGEAALFFCRMDAWEDMYDKYMRTRFLLWRMEFDMPESEYGELIDGIEHLTITPAALKTMILHSVIDKAKVFDKLIRYYSKFGQDENAKRVASWRDACKKYDKTVCYLSEKTRSCR